MSVHTKAITVGAVVAGLCAGCEIDPARDFRDAVPSARLRVTELQVARGEGTEEIGELDFEIRVYDADSGAEVGCTGELQGMEGADRTGTPYILLSDFVAPDRSYLQFGAVMGRRLRFEVIERDYSNNARSHCPSPINAEDDLVGASEAIDTKDLDTALPMQFGNVTHLVIGTSRTRL